MRLKCINPKCEAYGNKMEGGVEDKYCPICGHTLIHS